MNINILVFKWYNDIYKIGNEIIINDNEKYILIIHIEGDFLWAAAAGAVKVLCLYQVSLLYNCLPTYR